MSSEWGNWERVAAIVDDLLELPSAERDASIESRCGDDMELKGAVRELLASIASAETDDFLAKPAAVEHGFPEDPIATSLEGSVVGGFEIGAVLGRGGMGVVFAAKQKQPDRQVAVKVLRPIHASRDAISRFEVEAEILGRLHHPGIASVFASGIHRFEGDGLAFVLPWYAMEFIDGARTLTEHVRSEALPRSARFELFARVCDAVAHAHAMGVIHRDLKPANILVDHDGHPKVIDFGIARALGADGEARTRHTHTGQLIGTLRYMSPEQIDGDPRRIDVRCDVYALGAILYEILAGRPAFAVDESSIVDAISILRSSEPLALSKIDPTLRGEPEWIVLRAMEKDVGRRYAGAAALRDDCKRLLAHEALEAGPPSGIYRVAKFARRHRVLVGAITSVVLALSVGLIATQRALQRAILAEAKATDEATTSNQVVEMFRRVFDSACTQNKGRELKVVDALSDAASFTISELSAKPYLAARLIAQISGLHSSLGNLKESLELAERSIELLEADGRRLTDDALTMRISVVELRERLGDFDGARRMLDESEALAATFLPPESAARIDLEFERGLLFVRKGDATAAEPVLRAVCARREALLGTDDVNTIAAWSTLNVVLLDQGKFAEAEPIARRSLEQMERLRGRDDPASITMRVNLASLLGEAAIGKYAEARDQLIEALSSYERVTGLDFPDAILALVNLGTIRSSLDENDQAIADLDTACGRAKNKFGPAHPTTLQAISALARVKLSLGRIEEAEKSLRDALAAAAAASQEHDIMFFRLQATHADALRRLGRTDEARALLTEAHAKVRLALGDDAQEVQDMAASLRKLGAN